MNNYANNFYEQIIKDINQKQGLIKRFQTKVFDEGLEKMESGVEMLIVMEKCYKIKLIETEYCTIGVDFP